MADIAVDDIDKTGLDDMSLADTIYNFSKKLLLAQSEVEIYRIMLEDLPKELNFTGCILFELDYDTKSFQQVTSAGFIDDISSESPIKNKYISELIEESIRRIGKDSISDLKQQLNDNFKIVYQDTDILIPIILRKVIFGVIKGKSIEGTYVSESHSKVWQAITTISAGAILKIRDFRKLTEARERLEFLIQQKDSDLDHVIDQLSTQNSELKYFNEKQKKLLQEVHHRVTNNLQTISSIIRLYSYTPNINIPTVLSEINNRVQILSIIYQNVYQSMEKEYSNINTFLYDITNHLENYLHSYQARFNVQSKIKHLNIETLIPVGLFIAEILTFWVEKAGAMNINQVEINLNLECQSNCNKLVISIDDKTPPIEALKSIQSEDNITTTIISGLIEQLEGDFAYKYENGNIVKFSCDI